MQRNDLGLSLWLIPPESYHHASNLSKLTTTTFPTSPNFPQSPSFLPHISLTSFIPIASQFTLSSLELESLPPPDVQYSELAHSDAYFKFVFLRIKKTASLLALAKHVRDRIFPDAKSFDEASYDPHISLVYSDEQATEKRVKYVSSETTLALANSPGWTGGKVALVDTTSSNVEDWKIVDEWLFPES